MADTRSALKSRVEALFRELVAQDHRDALADEKARVDRERAKMARLRGQRLAQKADKQCKSKHGGSTTTRTTTHEPQRAHTNRVRSTPHHGQNWNTLFLRSLLVLT
jgi:hypothetical protein